MLDAKVRGAGSRVEFEEFAAVAWPQLYRYAYLLCGSHADAEDLAQQTLLKAMRSWSRVSSADSATAYLRRMLTNNYVSQRRPQRHRLEVLTEVLPEVGGSRSDAVEDGLVLWQQVKRLPARQRAVIVLRYYEGLSEDEIAETLGCSKGTVKSTAHHALKALRAAGDWDGMEARDGQ